MASMYSLGVDVGGTFTDLVALDEQSGSIWHCKVHSTPHDQSVGVQSGIERILSKLPDRESVAFRTINHGTTVATNTILEQNGAKVALIVTEGYKDILQTRRSHVPGGHSNASVPSDKQPANIPHRSCSLDHLENAGPSCAFGPDRRNTWPHWNRRQGDPTVR